MSENPYTENKPNKENSDINFEIKDNINIVTETKKQSNKATAIIAVSILFVVIIASVIFLLAKKDDNVGKTEDESSTAASQIIDYEEIESAFNSESFTNEEGQSVSADEYKDYVQNIVSEATTKFDNHAEATTHSIVENTTAASQDKNEEQTKLSYNKEKCESIIKTFLDRSCYLEGSLNDKNGTTPVAVAFDGDNFEMLTNLDGTEVSIVKVDGKVYLKRTALKQYAQLTEAVLQSFNLSVDMLAFDFGDNNYDSMKDKLTNITPATIDGKDGVCFRYDKQGDFFKFYFVDDQLIQLDVGNETTIRAQFIISYFSSAIPGDMLSFKGFKESGFVSLFADFM